jgi:hypothetical protein
VQGRFRAAVAAGSATTLTGLNEVTPGVSGQRPQPATETLGRIVREGAHPFGQPHQYHLGNIFGVCILEPALSTPGENAPTVTLDEVRPGVLVGRFLSEPAQQGWAGVRSGRVVHTSLRLMGGEVDIEFPRSIFPGMLLIF